MKQLFYKFEDHSEYLEKDLQNYNDYVSVCKNQNEIHYIKSKYGGSDDIVRIEYLKTLGHGDCYIDIPISNTGNFKKEFVFKAEHTNGKYDIVAQQLGTNTTFLFWSKNAGQFAVYFSGKESFVNTANSANQKVKVIAKQPNIIIDINGNITNVNCTTGTSTSSTYFRLFSQRTDRVGIISIYYFKVWDASDNLILDLIPVRIGTTGYMYNRVSGNLYGNSSTGNFTLGPDL